MTKSKLSNNDKVSKYISKLENNLAETIRYLTEIILETDTEIVSHIKRNSLSFYYSGEMKQFDSKEHRRDLLVLNIHQKDQITSFSSIFE